MYDIARGRGPREGEQGEGVGPREGEQGGGAGPRGRGGEQRGCVCVCVLLFCSVFVLMFS